MEPILSFDWDCGERPSRALISSMADLEGVPPTDLDPLAHAIDPHALDRLFDPTVAERPSNASVKFDYLGYHVSIDASGQGHIYDGQPVRGPTDDRVRPLVARGP